MEPLAAEVWVFDPTLTHVLLVQHRWRGWVPPGGGVNRARLSARARAVNWSKKPVWRPCCIRARLRPNVRSYKPEWSPTLGLSYSAIADLKAALRPEHGQPASWKQLDADWADYFPDDRERMLWHAQWLHGQVYAKKTQVRPSG